MLTLVLLPGMEGSGEFFTALINALGASIKTQVIAYPQENALSYSQLTGFVEKRLPKDAPYVLLGESFSGPIAINIAAAKPPNLQALILVCTFIRSPIPIPQFLRNIVCSIPASWIPFSIISRFLLGNHATPEISSRLKKILGGIPNHVFRERLLAILTVDASPALANIHTPILYLRATQDLIVPKTALELIMAQRPSVATADIAGPHFILQTQPTAAADLILGFIKVLKPPG